MHIRIQNRAERPNDSHMFLSIYFHIYHDVLYYIYFILFSHMFLSISRKALQRAKLRRLTTPTRKAASAYNVTIQGLQCVNENSSYFRSGKASQSKLK